MLVGDSGEQDPEIYAELAREHRGRIFAVIIRNVTGEPAGAPRYAQAKRDLPGKGWIVFDDPVSPQCAASRRLEAMYLPGLRLVTLKRWRAAEAAWG